MPEKQEIQIRNNYDLAKPVEMVSMAKVLKHHIVGQKLYTNIVGKNYAHVEGWQFAGGLMGTYPRVIAVENLSNSNEIRWKADVEIVNIKTGDIISRGFAICSNKESKKKSFDEYAVLSMAQTRAIGKAYRNVIGWVMKLAGYEATPSEEMAKMGDIHQAPPKEAPPEGPILCAGATKGGCPDGATINNIEAQYSTKVFGKQLCRNCQKITPKKQ